MHKDDMNIVVFNRVLSVVLQTQGVKAEGLQYKPANKLLYIFIHSRALRYYYDKNILTKLPGKRYSYKFDFPTLLATGGGGKEALYMAAVPWMLGGFSYGPTYPPAYPLPQSQMLPSSMPTYYPSHHVMPPAHARVGSVAMMTTLDRVPTYGTATTLPSNGHYLNPFTPSCYTSDYMAKNCGTDCCSLPSRSSPQYAVEYTLGKASSQAAVTQGPNSFSPPGHFPVRQESCVYGSTRASSQTLYQCF